MALFLFGSSVQAQNKVPVSGSSTPADKHLISFYPNPAVSFINFEQKKGGDNTYNLQIFNFMGRKVLDIKNMPNLLRVSLQDFYRGMYIFQLRDKNGHIVESGKFQVVK
jgi:hypothetical protein